MKASYFLLACLALMMAITACKPEEPDPITPSLCENNNVSADFTIFNQNCKAPCEISFDNSSRNATEYFWDFGDGSTADGAFPLHVYTQPGTYNIKLVASNGECRDSLILPVNIQERKTFEVTFGEVNDDAGASVIQTTDGGYLVAGYKESQIDGDRDIYLIKTTNTGTLQWEKTSASWGAGNDDFGRSVIQTTDGGYLMTGTTASQGAGNDDVYLIKTDDQGNVQ